MRISSLFQVQTSLYSGGLKNIEQINSIPRTNQNISFGSTNDSFDSAFSSFKNAIESGDPNQIRTLLCDENVRTVMQIGLTQVGIKILASSFEQLQDNKKSDLLSESSFWFYGNKDYNSLYPLAKYLIPTLNPEQTFEFYNNFSQPNQQGGEVDHDVLVESLSLLNPEQKQSLLSKQKGYSNLFKFLMTKGDNFDNKADFLRKNSWLIPVATQAFKSESKQPFDFYDRFSKYVNTCNTSDNQKLLINSASALEDRYSRNHFKDKVNSEITKTGNFLGLPEDEMTKKLSGTAIIKDAHFIRASLLPTTDLLNAIVKMDNAENQVKLLLLKQEWNYRQGYDSWCDSNCKTYLFPCDIMDDIKSLVIQNPSYLSTVHRIIDNISTDLDKNESNIIQKQTCSIDDMKKSIVDMEKIFSFAKDMNYPNIDSLKSKIHTNYKNYFDRLLTDTFK